MAFVRLRSKIVFTIFCLVLSWPALADEPGNYLKFTCIPEINYMEITTVFTEKEIDKAAREKHGILYPQDFSCKIHDSEITVIFTKVQPKEVYGDNGLMLGTAQRTFMDSMHDVQIMFGKTVIATIENFGSTMPARIVGNPIDLAYIPQIISYDGNMVYYCRYSGTGHECNFIRTDHKLLELKKNLQTNSGPK